MHLPKALVLAVLLPFALYSTYVVYEFGYINIFTSHFNVVGMQVLIDLVIACTLAMVWMWRDAAATGRNVWPFIITTLFLGSIGPLAYLLLAPQPHGVAARAHG